MMLDDGMCVESLSARSSTCHLLSISIVTYKADLALLSQTLRSLAVAVNVLRKGSPSATVALTVVNNGGRDVREEVRQFLPDWVDCHHIDNPRNIGFGRAHNLAIFSADSAYHLVLNPDIEFESDSLVKALSWFSRHPSVCALSPDVVDQGGRRSFLCRRFPRISVLLVRAFGARWLRRLARDALATYEMRDLIDGSQVIFDPPLISGCWMLFRTDSLRAIGGFDPGYFLYFEDYDLSLRIAKLGRLAYVPSVRVAHAGGGAAQKGFWHICLFCRSAIRFYRRHGWRL